MKKYFILKRATQYRYSRYWVAVFFMICCCFAATGVSAQQSAIAPGNGNPIIPGYFADPTVKKFGDTYYLYATTDGNGEV